MKAMLLHTMGKPLELQDISIPTPTPNQLLLKVESCGVYRTDLHIINGELTEPNLPPYFGAPDRWKGRLCGHTHE